MLAGLDTVGVYIRPGTSWVSGSFKTPMLHFVGLPLCSSEFRAGSSSSDPFEVEFRAKKLRGASEAGLIGSVRNLATAGALGP